MNIQTQTHTKARAKLALEISNNILARSTWLYFSILSLYPLHTSGRPGPTTRLLSYGVVDDQRSNVNVIELLSL